MAAIFYSILRTQSGISEVINDYDKLTKGELHSLVSMLEIMKEYAQKARDSKEE